MNPITTSLRATTKRSSGRVALFRVGCARDARLRLGASHIAQPQTQGEIESRPFGTVNGDADILDGNSHEYSGERLTSHLRGMERNGRKRSETKPIETTLHRGHRQYVEGLRYFSWARGGKGVPLRTATHCRLAFRLLHDWPCFSLGAVKLTY